MGRNKRPKGQAKGFTAGKKFRGVKKGVRYAAHSVHLGCSFCGERVHMLKEGLARIKATGRTPRCLLCNGELVPV